MTSYRTAEEIKKLTNLVEEQGKKIAELKQRLSKLEGKGVDE